MTPTIDLTSLTPAEIDQRLGPVHHRHAVALGRLRHARKQVKRRPADIYWHGEVERLTVALDEAADELWAFDDEWQKRGGWTRSWLCVTNGSGGHFHRTQFCQSLSNTSMLALAYSLSGADDTTLVDMAGSDACTFCYPNAPVDREANGSKAAKAIQACRDAQNAAKGIARLVADIERDTALVDNIEAADTIEAAETLRSGRTVVPYSRVYSRFSSYTRPIVDKRSKTNAVKKARRLLAEDAADLERMNAIVAAAAHLEWETWQEGQVPAARKTT